MTRQEVETIIVKRLSGWLNQAGMSTITNGTNPDLNDSIGWAIRKLGGSVANPINVTNADLLNIGPEDALLDLVELRTLETIQTNYVKVNSTVGPRKEEFNNLRTALSSLIPARRKQIESEWGIDLGELKDAKFKVWNQTNGLVRHKVS